ncbi:MAG: nicotinate (nicotinamide) nucleotide adenylyltransferase [Ruminococcaceae bacterium]|nr:nicotinate (nicotinamide) nucleotide adenylyltransferase [Oscillospiraceae bacterium]
MKTGIFGGTFSPPHIGHIGAARAFSEQMGLDELLIIPTAIPPHKTVGYGDNPIARLRMCKIAFSDIKNVQISDMEIKRGGKSYTVLTLRELAREGRELYLLCGTDMLLTLDTWFCAEEIFSLCTPVGIRRENDSEAGELLRKKLAEYKDKFSSDITMIDADAINISSSELRELIASGKPTENYLTPEILHYIKENGLYGSK